MFKDDKDLSRKRGVGLITLDQYLGGVEVMRLSVAGMFAGGLFAAQHPVGQEVLHAAGLEAQQPIPQQPQPAPYRALPGLCHPFYYVDVVSTLSISKINCR